jgi:hypothetical protein
MRCRNVLRDGACTTALRLEQPRGLKCSFAIEVLGHPQDLAVAKLEDVEQPLADLHSAPSATAEHHGRGHDHLAVLDDLLDHVPGIVPRIGLTSSTGQYSQAGSKWRTTYAATSPFCASRLKAA